MAEQVHLIAYVNLFTNALAWQSAFVTLDGELLRLVHSLP